MDITVAMLIVTIYKNHIYTSTTTAVHNLTPDCQNFIILLHNEMNCHYYILNFLKKSSLFLKPAW